MTARRVGTMSAGDCRIMTHPTPAWPATLDSFIVVFREAALDQGDWAVAGAGENARPLIQGQNGLRRELARHERWPWPEKM